MKHKKISNIGTAKKAVPKRRAQMSEEERHERERKKSIEVKSTEQQIIAKKLNVVPERISEFLNGKHEIKVNTLKNWCEILNINIIDLFSDKYDDLIKW